MAAGVPAGAVTGTTTEAFAALVPGGAGVFAGVVFAARGAVGVRMGACVDCGPAVATTGALVGLDASVGITVGIAVAPATGVPTGVSVVSGVAEATGELVAATALVAVPVAAVVTGDDVAGIPVGDGRTGADVACGSASDIVPRSSLLTGCQLFSAAIALDFPPRGNGRLGNQSNTRSAMHAAVANEPITRRPGVGLLHVQSKVIALRPSE